MEYKKDNCQSQGLEVDIPDDRIGQGFVNYYSDGADEPQGVNQTIDIAFTGYQMQGDVVPLLPVIAPDKSAIPDKTGLSHSHSADNDSNAKAIQVAIDAQAVVMATEEDVDKTLLGELDVSYLLNSDSTGQEALPDVFPPAPEPADKPVPTPTPKPKPIPTPTPKPTDNK